MRDLPLPPPDGPAPAPPPSPDCPPPTSGLPRRSAGRWGGRHPRRSWLPPAPAGLVYSRRRGTVAASLPRPLSPPAAVAACPLPPFPCLCPFLLSPFCRPGPPPRVSAEGGSPPSPPPAGRGARCPLSPTPPPPPSPAPGAVPGPAASAGCRCPVAV